MEELMLKIENVKKMYKLGQIGGTTLRDELQRAWAKIRKKEDPTKKIGAKNYNQGETFMALNGVSFEVKKGERVGIIGHNGAGKSTLLKLISRITAPTDGTISLNGRIASMLEVGTGFHPELTGRENVYMNGAILGMTKKEIDAKMENIIEFSEVRQFIDTPVKRYSSGMYVKLAFSVAAHLDSEIMIMDEVLAVGDMAFQKKCLDKMNQVSQDYGRTILYVSHNMNTIRQLCNRVVVLDHGKVVFNGDVESGIGIYMNIGVDSNSTMVDLDILERPHWTDESFKARMKKFELLEKVDNNVERGEKIKIKLSWATKDNQKDVKIRIMIRTPNDNSTVGTAVSKSVGDCSKDSICSAIIALDTVFLAKGIYFFDLELFQDDGRGNQLTMDSIKRSATIYIRESNNKFDTANRWPTSKYGYIHYPELEILEQVKINSSGDN